MTESGSLCSGYGGLDLAVESFFDAQTRWFVEYDHAPSRLLAHHWPDVPNYGDITTLQWDSLPPVDILTGGYPCQPFSHAGGRAGRSDERHLWPYIREGIRVLRPRFTVLENVAGHRSLGFDRVLGEVAEDGFDVRWVSVRATEVGAPHQRDRLFFVIADPASGGFHSWPGFRTSLQDRLGWRRLGDGDSQADSFGKYANGVRRWERIVGRPVPQPNQLSEAGHPQLSPRLPEWMMGLPEGWVTGEVGLTRAEQLRAIGNGVCPQQAYHALSLIFQEDLWI